ncbi:MAG TPA: S53 family peptidase, partial [Candidatus Angelobacter sp.]|nr:S53 family peptidase [Candidatus Angelobacter sp.]
AKVTVDIVLKVKNKDALANYINDTVTPGNKNYHNYLSVNQFSSTYAPAETEVSTVVNYLQSFGLKTTVYSDNLVITVTGQVKHINKAFNVNLQKAGYKGKAFHATKHNPTVPRSIGDDILCILGLTDYSNLTSDSVTPFEKQTVTTPNNLNGYLGPQDLIQHYGANELYENGTKGKGQTIGIVTLADFNKKDAYVFWKAAGIDVKANRINKIKVDGGSDFSGYEETTLDVEQSGALAPDATINVYVAPNGDTGFLDGFAQAINDNSAQQISVSWGQSETIINNAVQQNEEAPQYAEAFDQLFMQAAAQGISTFASSGDGGAYDTTTSENYYDLAVDHPADSPYITAAGGTTLPLHLTSKTGIKVDVDYERAWGWDYLFPVFKSSGLDVNSGYYFEGGGGGFSAIFATPDYQKNVPGVNQFTGVRLFDISPDLKTAALSSEPSSVNGTHEGKNGNGARNVPDLAMDADPETGYAIYVSDPGQPGSHPKWYEIGGTSIVAPQLNGFNALINSAGNTKVGFWNPQIYHFAQQENSPFNPLTDSGTTNDNLFYTGTPDTIYNQATGLGTPNLSALAKDFLEK